jgi:hypothetical protein
VSTGSANTAKILLRAFVTPENEVIVQVIDNGTGLEDTQKYSMPYDNQEKGMGIGLAILRSIVEAHGDWASCPRRKSLVRGQGVNHCLSVSSVKVLRTSPVAGFKLRYGTVSSFAVRVTSTTTLHLAACVVKNVELHATGIKYSSR